MRTLIVDADYASRVLMQTLLSRYGECEIAANGVEAVAAFRAAQERGQEYDLVCTDIMMPEMDGHTAVREIRRLEEALGARAAVKIIMTTASADVENVLKSVQGCCDAYLLKPIDAAKLHNRIKDLPLAV